MSLLFVEDYLGDIQFYLTVTLNTVSLWFTLSSGIHGCLGSAVSLAGILSYTIISHCLILRPSSGSYCYLFERDV